MGITPTYKMSTFPTNYQNVDLLIISKLDFSSLHIISKLNRHLHSLCCSDQLWYELIVDRYPTAINYIDRNKTFKENYKQFEEGKKKIDDTIKKGYLNVLKWLSQLEHPILPNQYGLHVA